MREQEIKVPDIGDFHDVDVIDVLVAPGDRVAKEDPLITLETDKASMDVPSPAAGEVLSVAVSAGSKVSEGSLILTLGIASDAGVPPSEDGGGADPATDSADAETGDTASVPAGTGRSGLDASRSREPCLERRSGASWPVEGPLSG